MENKKYLTNYKKVILICPDFEKEHIYFENFFSHLNIPCKSILFKESDFAKKINNFSKIILKIIRLIASEDIYKKLRFNTNDFDSFLLNQTKDILTEDTLVFFVKPYLINSYSFLSHLKRTTNGYIFYTYDSFKRFPFSKLIPKDRIITFDIDDALKKNINYSPIPRTNNNIRVPLKNYKSFILYGSFSLYRFIRVLIANLILRGKGIKFHCYLMHHFFYKQIKFFGIYFGNKRRNIRSNYITLDIPQNEQSGGSFRSSSNDLFFSYSYTTPRWRYLNSSNLIIFLYDIKRISKLSVSKNIQQLYLDEFKSSFSSLEISIENILSSATLDRKKNHINK